MNFKYAIFDMDGTLLNSMDYWDKCERAAIKELCGVDFLDGPLSNHLYTGLENLVDTANKYSHRVITLEEVIPLTYSIMRDVYKSHSIKPVDGAPEFLKMLKDSGIPTAIATATPFDFCRECLEENGILSLIDSFVSTDVVGKGKSHPDVYLTAMQNIGADKENTVIFEDAPYCINTLYNHNFRYIIVDDSIRSTPIPDMHKMKAEKYIYSYKELISHD